MLKCCAGPLLLFTSLAVATTLRVPHEYSTIQSALNAVSWNDTILVSTGMYAEALMAPPLSFALRGDVGADTSERARPVLDPSSLAGADTLVCLTTSGGVVTIEDFAFRNGERMYPRDWWDPGGILNHCEELYISRCTFDSTCNSISTWNYPATLANCRFRKSVYSCVYSVRRIIATDCIFHSVNWGWAEVSGADSCRFERCDFSGLETNCELLAIHGTGNRVADCRFHDLGSLFSAINTHSTHSVFERNVFEQCVTTNVVQIGSADGSIVFRDNVFRRIQYRPEVAGGWCVGVSSCSPDSGPCESLHIEGNIFQECPENALGAIVFYGLSYISRNRFDHLALEGRACVLSASEQRGGVLRDNYFEGNGLGVAADILGNYAYVDARLNWWGDSSGPYHPVLNPDGQGDAVSDSVEFEPWYTDTTFAYSEREHNAPIVASATLEVFPNPFNSEARIRFAADRTVDTRVVLYDLLGREVGELFAGRIADEKTFTFQAPDLPSGIYFVRAWDNATLRSLAVAKLALIR